MNAGGVVKFCLIDGTPDVDVRFELLEILPELELVGLFPELALTDFLDVESDLLDVVDPLCDAGVVDRTFGVVGATFGVLAKLEDPFELLDKLPIVVLTVDS